MIAEFGKLSKELLSEPKLERNSSLRQWQRVYLSRRYKKVHGKQTNKQKKK